MGGSIIYQKMSKTGFLLRFSGVKSHVPPPVSNALLKSSSEEKSIQNSLTVLKMLFITQKLNEDALGSFQVAKALMSFFPQQNHLEEE